jgi:Spy/CpxP family protein refolding chaperone
MHTRTKKRGILLLAVLMTATAVTATAGCHRHNARSDLDTVDLVVSWKLEMLLDELDATPAQRTEFRAAKDWLLDEIAFLRAEHRMQKGEIVAELRKDNPDERWLHAHLDEKMATHQRLAHDILDTILGLHATLRPEQREQLFDIVRTRLGVRGGAWFGTPNAEFDRTQKRHGRRHGRKVRAFIRRMLNR